MYSVQKSFVSKSTALVQLSKPNSDENWGRLQKKNSKKSDIVTKGR